MKKILLFLGTICLVAGLFSAGVFTYEAHALDEETAVWVEEARGALQEIVQERDIMALVYLSDEYPVRVQASYDAEVLVTVPSGQMVEIKDVFVDDNYEVWEYVSLLYGTNEYQGYIPRSFLACSDEKFLEWEASYGMNPAANVVAYSVDGTQRYVDIEQFPASYQAALTALKQKHPNWTFVKMNTGLDWDTVIYNQLQGGRSLVYKTFPDYTKAGAYDDGNWFYATEEILEYYMDPRNALTEDGVFQFELLTYNKTYHTEAAVETFLNNTFMNSSQYAPGTSMTFAHIFWAIGAEEGREVSPFHLAARVYQEQGQGTSGLISGTYPGYEGYYNYFNVGATGTSTTQVIENGLKYAKEKGWTDAYFSILGGADVISANYIKRGQDTLYLQKYNVNPNGYYALYTHQYMQNISAPTSEGKSMKNLYASANSLENTFVFKIPVYENMPEGASPMPTASTDVILEYPSGYSDTTVYLDGVAYTAQAQNGKYVVKAPDTGAKTAVVYRYNESGVPVGMYVWTLSYANNAYTATAQPGLADLLTYHGFSIRITGNSGIRFKTGISTDVRAALTSGGVNGYKLKEYGTLVMNNANRASYPMIKGGEKVLSGMSYGTNASGGLDDKIYATTGGRYHFTSVLVGLPANQYKVEYAFRGYIVLEKDGAQITLYGPVVARSIYSLAQQLLQMGTYPQGSDADLFLRQLISDGDAAG